ncbi:hypothetical protein ZWY2020_033124 [Hordeum vulgare]|nr:hypothetical protein ZWY2020_033124 [Hordeum vulgare]
MSAVKTYVAAAGFEESIDRIEEIVEEAPCKARLGPRRFPTTASSRNMAGAVPWNEADWNEGRTEMREVMLAQTVATTRGIAIAVRGRPCTSSLCGRAAGFMAFSGLSMYVI